MAAKKSSTKQVLGKDLNALLHVESGLKNSVESDDKACIGFTRRVSTSSKFMYFGKILILPLIVLHSSWLGVQATAFRMVGPDVAIALQAVSQRRINGAERK